MPQKSKCSPEEKARAVEVCLKGSVSRNPTLFKYKIGETTLRRQGSHFRASGIEGLTPEPTFDTTLSNKKWRLLMPARQVQSPCLNWS